MSGMLAFHQSALKANRFTDLADLLFMHGFCRRVRSGVNAAADEV